jgi:hypothetical protein
MIIILLFLATFASLIGRIILINILKGRGLAGSVLDLSGGILSITYLFPLKLHKLSDTKVRRLVKIANAFLYLFFIFFAILILYGVVTELPHFI